MSKANDHKKNSGKNEKLKGGLTIKKKIIGPSPPEKILVQKFKKFRI